MEGNASYVSLHCVTWTWWVIPAYLIAVGPTFRA